MVNDMNVKDERATLVGSVADLQETQVLDLVQARIQKGDNPCLRESALGCC